MYVQKQYFNILQELLFLNAADQRLSTLRLKLVALKKCNVSFNFYIVIITTCCQLVYIFVGGEALLCIDLS